ncbi:MAG TPA: hypothetical protein VEZ90_11965 [Blastocatellia bacterium]|nr:hypothetical protein [Blastocatellia bacterium]
MPCATTADARCPINDMGDPKNITNKTFEDAARAAGESVDDAKRNTLDLLREQGDIPR